MFLFLRAYSFCLITHKPSFVPVESDWDGPRHEASINPENLKCVCAWGLVDSQNCFLARVLRTCTSRRGFLIEPPSLLSDRFVE